MDSFTLSPIDNWRGIILLGKNTATYKIALAKCLIKFANIGKNQISMDELSQEFFNLYNDRLLINNKPQLNHANRKTKMEHIIDKFRIGKLTENQAIEEVKIGAFNDVLPRFHTIDRVPVKTAFYSYDFFKGLTLTDESFHVLNSPNINKIISQLDTRWDLLEAAFEINKSSSKLQNDIREFYLINGYERSSVTHLRSALDGYQNGMCFYCNLPMQESQIDVDHVIPRQLVHHDDVWNLVLTHSFCNQQKSDLLPSIKHIENLIYRNEFLIISNHPLKQKIIDKLGNTPTARRNSVLNVYKDAQQVLKYTWEEIRGYNPTTDPLYLSFVRH